MNGNPYHQNAPWYDEIMGNNPAGGYTVGEVGCYITTMANASVSWASHFGTNGHKRELINPSKINADKSLFLKGSGVLADQLGTLKKIFGNGQIFSKKSVDLKAKLQELKNSGKAYFVLGVFDLSKATKSNPKITPPENHMVGINDIADVNGVISDITPTSTGDRARLGNESDKKEYNIENLKEIWVIEANASQDK